jgi:hypothetical protein
MRLLFCLLLLAGIKNGFAQAQVDVSAYRKNGATVSVNKKVLTITWPTGASGFGRMVLNLDQEKPLFGSILLGSGTDLEEVAGNLDPAFVLTVGKRTLSPSSGGWDVFFDKVPSRPYKSYALHLIKDKASVQTEGSRTVVSIGSIAAASFTGNLEITLYNGSPLFNIAAVIHTKMDSTAILYDAGLVSKGQLWKKIAWSDTKSQVKKVTPLLEDTSRNLEVKYRTIIGEHKKGSLALFPAPHQYFYPLDEAFNLKFTWYGKKYLNLISDFGIGIRQDPLGDKRYVPWFNAPPQSNQRLNFFCLLSNKGAEIVLDEVKKYTHNDSYEAVPGYKTMASHFHNEFISNIALSGKPIPEHPEFVEVLKKTGINIVKLAEFHGPGHPKGPDEVRLKELQSLFEQTKRLSDDKFLLLPGEEANNFYGGHWLAFFPKPVYWIMSRKPEIPFMEASPGFGKVYHIRDKEEMLKLLELENGLAWVAHARTKGSTGYPDNYRAEKFFKSDTYMGAAWKAIPADLSLSTLSQRVLTLMDDMANWGLRKHVIAEADIFTITEENEMYAHLNVNYLQLEKLPKYEDGWQPVLDILRKGKFFVSTGEVLLPKFNINKKTAGETLKLDKSGKAIVNAELTWTYPMNYAEIISGDGANVYRERINLNETQAFGKKLFSWKVNLKNKKWVRIEAWDIAANGVFSQMIWLE